VHHIELRASRTHRRYGKKEGPAQKIWKEEEPSAEKRCPALYLNFFDARDFRSERKRKTEAAVKLGYRSSATRFLGVDLASEPNWSRDAGFEVVEEMSGEDEQGAPANRVGGGAVHLGLGLGEVGDLAKVLEVLGVAEQDDTLDLVLDCGGELGDSVGHDRSSLGVATRNDGGRGTLGVGHLEETLGLVDGALRGAGRKEVLSQPCGVRAANTLSPD